MSLLLRRRMLLAQQKKSSNLFDEGLLLTYDKQGTNEVIKDDRGYEFIGYPVIYSRDLVTHLKNVLKPDTDYTLARDTQSVGAASAGAIAIRSASGALLVFGDGYNGKLSKTFKFTQEQINSITSVYIYGTGIGGINSGGNRTIFKYFQLVEGAYTKDTLPPYEPF